MVPVLSNTTIVALAIVSIWAADLNKIPRFAPSPSPTSVATGVARASGPTSGTVRGGALAVVGEEERHLADLGLSNYWGYNPAALFVPDPRLAPGGIDELRDCVAALQAAGIEATCFTGGQAG